MSPVSPARDEAYRALRRVNAGQADLPEAIGSARERLHDERDRALAAEIATGTLRWQAALDAVIAAVSGRSTTRLDPEVLDVLRLSAYQLLHLDRIPPSAAVNEGVELVRRHRKRSAAPLVNAVLRRIAQSRTAPPLPPRPANPTTDREAALDYVAITLSHPRWLAARWLDRWGFEAVERWARFNNTPSPLTLRVNTWRSTRDDVARQLADHGVVTEPTRFAPLGLHVLEGNPLRTPLASRGLFMVQDEASQLVALATLAGPGERLLDACAAPGGKTLAMVAATGNQGLVVAADVRPRRVALLQQTLAAAGADCARVVRLDAASPLPFEPVFDAVLLDAPCSGLGTIRRDPEIRWRRTEADLPRLAAVQERMLEHAAAVVRPGGRLIYSTCSSEPEENEAVVSAFLARHPGFAQVPLGRPGSAGSLLAPVTDESGRLRTWPHLHGLEAFFAALLTRTA
jgi:16S rRNA (cytosine967-C5)-methyltransferase